MKKLMAMVRITVFVFLAVFLIFQTNAPAGSITNFPNGVSSFGIPVVPGMELGKVWGKVFFVDSAGSDDNNGESPDEAKATIQAAIDITGDGTGDKIFVRNGAYAESLTVSTSHDGIMIIGESKANVVITGATDATDTLIVEADDCTFANMSFAAYDAGSDISLIKVTGDNNRFESLAFVGAEYQIETSGADDTMILGCTFVTPVDVTDGAAIVLEDSNNCKVLFCSFNLDNASDAIIHHDADNLEVGWCNAVGDDDTGASTGYFVFIVGADGTSELSVHDNRVTLFAAVIGEDGALIAAHGYGTSDITAANLAVTGDGNQALGCTTGFDTTDE